MTKREKMENLIYLTFDQLDPTGKNTSNFRLKFSSMSDEEFNKYILEYISNEGEFYLDNVPINENLSNEDFQRIIEMIQNYN